MPSGSFAANSAWPALAAIAFNLTRAAGTIASVFHAKATTATIRRQLIAVPGRLARSARRLVTHLPKEWPWQDSWEGLFSAACGPPTPSNDLTTQPRQCPTKDPVEKPDRPAATSRPTAKTGSEPGSPSHEYFVRGSRFSRAARHPKSVAAAMDNSGADPVVADPQPPPPLRQAVAAEPCVSKNGGDPQMWRRTVQLAAASDNESLAPRVWSRCPLARRSASRYGRNPESARQSWHTVSPWWPRKMTSTACG
jgi:hypothetical protein